MENQNVEVMNKWYKPKMKSVDELAKTTKPSPIWVLNHNESKRRNSLSYDDKCFCGSGKNYGNCCMGLNPIQILQNSGHKILKDELGRIIVGVDKSFNVFEGMGGNYRKEPITNFQFVPISEITDYNSLWKITESGWDSKSDETLYPYICVDVNWYRWDESQFIRPLCNTFSWSELNYQKLNFYLINDKSKIPPLLILENKIGRNDKCKCGSGLKYKKCCGKVKTI